MTTIAVIKASAFLLFSIGVIYISRSSLRLPLTHGLPRFFAWETILAMFLLIAEKWFNNPFSVNQILSWLLLVISLVLILLGVWTLRAIGQPNASREGNALLGIEKTTTLVNRGIYHYIRHPFYSSLLFLAWGLCFKSLSWLGVLLAFIATIFLEFTAVIEEREDIRFFGIAYQEYIKKTKKFIPFLY